MLKNCCRTTQNMLVLTSLISSWPDKNGRSGQSCDSNSSLVQKNWTHDLSSCCDIQIRDGEARGLCFLGTMDKERRPLEQAISTCQVRERRSRNLCR